MAPEPSKTLKDAIDRVQDIMSVAGVPALSFAIVQNGETVGTYHRGFRDVEKQLAPNDQTRYNINSLTKALMAALVGIEMHDQQGQLDWSKPIRIWLTSFDGSTPEITNNSTIVDLMSHRWGASGFDDLWFGCNNAVYLSRDETLRTAATLGPAKSFRSSFEYNNWGYEVLAQLLEHVSGQELGALLENKLFAPLGMSRTSLNYDSSDDNEAKSYGILLNKSPVEVERPFHGDSSMMKAAGGIKSSIEDLLVFYKAFMKAVTSQFDDSTDSTEGVPLKNCRMISSHHSTLPGSSLREQGYALGWARAQLPGQLGRISANPVIGDEPVSGKGGPSRLVLYHHGLMPGSTSVVLLVPELQSAVVVLQSSMPPIDTADFIGQMLLEALLEVPNPNDYVKLTKEFHAKALNKFDQIGKQLDDDRIPGTRPRPLSCYKGRYWNKLENFFIDITDRQGETGPEGLFMTVNGIPEQSYKLEHYHHDTFSWLMSYDETTRRARVLFYDPEYFLVQFREGKDGVSELLWVADGNFEKSPLILSTKQPESGDLPQPGLPWTTRLFSWGGGQSNM